MYTIPRPVLTAAVVGALSLSACSPSTDDPATSAGAPGQESEVATPTLNIAAAFYPLAYVAEHVAGDHGNIQELTAPGVEPHDLELSPVAVREMQQADVVLYLTDFQPAVDDAVAATDVESFDAATVVPLADAADHESEVDAEDGHADHDHAEDDHAEDDHAGHDHGNIDPHFWLDPTLLATYASAVGEEFAKLDPANAADYTANASALVSDLTGLDSVFSDGLAQCERSDIFVTHEAFGYLTSRYGLHQEGLSGIDPDAEPSPARVREIRDLMAADGATTVFTESLVSANVAEALASDAGVTTAVLDPIEGVTGNDDYMSVMNRNLSSLQGALNCA
ncbi:metal ABC transporter substrate-binding protein [Demequina oxidasica]|uniref:metal ABC transporter substrate-binding protein n=1 Tax=Demequina oxidasica TaxID=676199 RepID=UPI0007809667|nr:zinc ABC transporter substrate-binding protein [Demequina oxidasica]